MLQTLMVGADCIAAEGCACTAFGLEPGWIEPTDVEHRASLDRTMLSKLRTIEV